MEYYIDPKVVEIIDDYMNRQKDVVFGTERFCMATFKAMCEEVFHKRCSIRLVSIKGTKQEPNIFDRKYRTYFDGSTWHQYSWFYGRSGCGYKYFIKGKCEIYFQKHAREIISLFIGEMHSNIGQAILDTDCFLQLWNEFGSWFEDRRKMFMEKMEVDIQNVRDMSAKKTPQSHGGVANLLKVLTKTMEKQGADITSIAKVQYAICVQAGIYIPDEFIRDVAVTLDMPINKESEE